MRQYAIQYNHLGQLTQVTDDAGVRTIGYNAYGEQETDSLLAGGKIHLVTEARNALGRPSGYIRTAYTYSPYGQVTSTGDVEQTIQWSSEYNDTELGLVYYNYRHYNPVDGRWTGRDTINTNESYKNAYIFDLKKISSRHKSSTIFSVCDYCGNTGKYRDEKGVDHNWQKDALMLHEAQHAIDWCASIRNKTIKETRAYYFFNLKQGSATDKHFIEALMLAVKRSTKDFQEDVFYATLKELMNQ